MKKQSTWFISVLGTNDYLPCNYFFYPRDKHKVDGVRFVQEAILRLLAQEEEMRPDEVVIFATKGAYNANWKDDGHTDIDGKTLKRKGLKSCLKEACYSPKRQEIPEGKSEEEIWQIFQRIINSVPENVQLIVDITHSFRSLSMILLAAIQYLKAVKNVEIAGIHYGALEALGSLRDVQKMDKSERNVPIFDLTPFDAIMDWAKAAANFVESGNSKALYELSLNKINPILRQTKGRDEQAKQIRGFVDGLNKFCSNLATNRGPEISKSAQNVQNNLEKTKKTDLLPPLVPLFEKIEQELQGFDGDSLDVAVRTALWCLDHNFIPQGFTALQEGIITWFLEQINNKDILDVETRDLVVSAFVICNRSLRFEKWNKPSKNNVDLITRILEIDGFEQLAPIMDKLSQRRNNINHHGYNKDKVTPEVFKRDLKEVLDKIKKWKASLK